MPERKSEERVLILAPFGQDAPIMSALLDGHGYAAAVCDATSDLCREIPLGAGALLLTEEALELPTAPDLFDLLKGQPPWSELPLIILTKGGESRVARLLDLVVSAAGSVTLLERPLRQATLLRCVDFVLRFRRRQYRLRDLMETLRQSEAKYRELAENLEKAVAERTADLRTTNEQLETYVYSVAHDLRAPLRAITGYSQWLQEDCAPRLEEHAGQLLSRIRTAATFMDKLLLDLLAYERTARGEIAVGPVKVAQAWQSAMTQCAAQIEQTQACVETCEPLPEVLGHEITLGQCLANLLSNGLKFVSGDVRPRVRLRAENGGAVVRLYVEDNGIGIPKDQQERVFRVFERLHGTRFPGTGIGLSLVRKGVERMGGRITLESEPGKGTTFCIELKHA